MRAYQPTVKMIYQLLALHIKIFGDQEVPVGSNPKRHPMEDALKSARDYFSPCLNFCEKLISIFLFNGDSEDALNWSFQSFIDKLGQYVAGDEKLIDFTGGIWGCSTRSIKARQDWFMVLWTVLPIDEL